MTIEQQLEQFKADLIKDIQEYGVTNLQARTGIAKSQLSSFCTGNRQFSIKRMIHLKKIIKGII